MTESWPTSELSALSAALDVVAEHAGLNHRYRKLIAASRAELDAERVRTTQARGIAKRLLVLVKAAGPDFAGELPADAARDLRAGLDQADVLVHDTPPESPGP
ncbi:hypothetical protein [Saccharopolyspora sp. CA-218241]|uniref:hypothetical protein n=1 Tax=Saccharopolyspora sp. CA-218241 TaxID=3240027 RepID=UPI003D95331C